MVMTKITSGGGGGGLTPVRTITCDGSESFVDFDNLDGGSYLLDYAVDGGFNDLLMMNVNGVYDDGQYSSYSDYLGVSSGCPLNAVAGGCSGLVKVSITPGGMVQVSSRVGVYWDVWKCWRPECHGRTLFGADSIASLRVKTMYGTAFAQGSRFTLYKFNEAPNG
jgi:hypothetical protein